MLFYSFIPAGSSDTSTNTSQFIWIRTNRNIEFFFLCFCGFFIFFPQPQRFTEGTRYSFASVFLSTKMIVFRERHHADACLSLALDVRSCFCAFTASGTKAGLPQHPRVPIPAGLLVGTRLHRAALPIPQHLRTLNQVVLNR